MLMTFAETEKKISVPRLDPDQISTPSQQEVQNQLADWRFTDMLESQSVNFDQYL